MVMTREEVEEIVAHHMAHAVAQIGKDLEDKYATKKEVVENIKVFGKSLSETVQKEIKEWEKRGLQFASDLAEGRDLPKDSPLTFVTEVLDDITTLQLRVMELSLLVVLGRKRGLIDKSLEKTVRLEALMQTLTARQRREVLAEMEKFSESSPHYKDGFREVREFLGGE